MVSSEGGAAQELQRKDHAISHSCFSLDSSLHPHPIKRLFECQHGGRAHVPPAARACPPPLSSSSPASPFQGRQGFNLGLYPLNRSSPYFIHTEPWCSHCLHCKCCWHRGHTLWMLTQPQTRPMTFLLLNQKRKKKGKKEKKPTTTKPNPKPCKKTHATPVGARLLFKETFLPNYLKASSATWWWHPPWPAHPPTVCLGGEGLHPTPPHCPHPDG